MVNQRVINDHRMMVVPGTAFHYWWDLEIAMTGARREGLTAAVDFPILADRFIMARNPF